MAATFPILGHAKVSREYPGCPASVPWEILAPHAAQAMRNHDQTLGVLARRGGLSPIEMACVILDQCYHHMPTDVAIEIVNRAIRQVRGDEHDGRLNP